MLYRYLGYFEGKKAAPQTPKVSSPVSYRGLSIGDNLIITEASELKKKKPRQNTEIFLMVRAFCLIPYGAKR